MLKVPIFEVCHCAVGLVSRKFQLNTCVHLDFCQNILNQLRMQRNFMENAWVSNKPYLRIL
jgi:hypothetical protein